MAMPSRILFIINPTAGANRASARWSSLASRLGHSTLKIEQVLTSRPGEATNLARAASSDHDLLVAVGGDGTVSEVAEGILSAPANRAALAIVPFGTGNDVASVLGVRTETDAIRSLTEDRTQSIDVIRVHCQSNGTPVLRHALLFAGVGIITESLKRTTPAYKRLFGQRLAYPAGLIRALWSYRSPPMRVTCDQNVLEQKFLFVGASNTELAGGGMRIAPGARIDDAVLNINLIEEMGCFRALMQLRRLCRGQHTADPKVRYLTARTLELDAMPALEIAADGDLLGQTPARISVRPKALRVRVPAA